MLSRRILSLWFPRLGAERLLRQARGTIDVPFVVVAQRGNAQVLASLCALASAAGLRRGQALRDAQAMCPKLMTRLQNTQAEALFLASLRRWAGKFTPWVSEEAPASLVLDITGCAHLFGGELALLRQLEADCRDLGLTVRCGIADTVGAAWALARYAGRAPTPSRSGDAIDQEAPATRARAVKRRHWERGGPAPARLEVVADTERIAPPGQTRQYIGALPIAALRLAPNIVAELARLGLRHVSDVSGQPRAGLSRRFGRELILRLDQAMGVVPEPVSPARPEMHFACRLTLPDPIGLESDVLAALDRVLPRLCAKLHNKGRGARHVRLQCFRTDHSMQSIEIGLARPTWESARIRPLIAMKLVEIDAGFGIDAVRIEAYVTEPISAQQHRGHVDAGKVGQARANNQTAMDDLLGRLGARIGLEALTRHHPGDSHIPEKTARTVAAAWSEPVYEWSNQSWTRPVLLWSPEPVSALQKPQFPRVFRWRRRQFETTYALGPERIAPEWWLDEPAWRSGTRDYWRVDTREGDSLWLFFAHGGAISGGWFCHGAFA